MDNVKYDLEKVVKEIEKVTGQKAVKDQIFKTTYLIGHVEEENLIDIGFKCFGNTNRAGFVTPLYKMGNIEAVFIEQVLHVAEITA